MAACAAGLFWSSPARGQLTYLATEDLQLVYPEVTLSYLSPHAARCFENAMEFHRELWGWTPSERVGVLLTDFSDSGNAGAGTVPRNNMAIEVAPLAFDYETISGNERMNWIMNHEMVHIVAMDQATKADRRWRRLFGGKVMPIAEQPETMLYFYLTAPRVSAPRWYQEGIATFLETWMAGGRGRAQGTYDEMVFRSMVKDGSYFYDPLGLDAEGRKIDFQVESNSYLYGTRFLSYLAYQYGPEKVIDWVSRREGSKRYYAKQFKHVFGEPLPVIWAEWIAWEAEFQEKNLAAIREFPITPYEDLSERALGSVSRASFDPDRNRLYAAFNYPGTVAHIGSISLDDGSVERIIDIKDPIVYAVTSMTYDPDTKTIFYTTDNHEYRDLRSVDPETGKSETLIKDLRVGSLAFNRADRSIWGVRHFNGIATLVRIPAPYEEWNQVHSWPYGEVIYDPTVSPDGRYIAGSVAEITGRHALHVWEIERLLAGEVEGGKEVSYGGTVPGSFTFSPSGRFLFGTSTLTGTSNVFRYELATGESEAMTNTDSGFFRPIPLDDSGDLIVFRYTGDGFVPARLQVEPLEDVNPIVFLGQQLAEKHPVVREWVAGSPGEIELEPRIQERGDYGLGGNLGFETAFPVIEGYKDSVAFGYRFNFSDPLSLNRLDVTASYSPDDDLASDERFHFDLNYRRYDWRLHARWNNADFYDLFGPTKIGRRGYSAGVGYRKSLINDRPRYMSVDFDVTFAGDLDTLPSFQNVPVVVDTLLTTEVLLAYRNARKSLGAVDDEKGFLWNLMAADQVVDGHSVPLLHGNFDFGWALPIGHSSIWLRNAAGRAFGRREDPFSNFYFGGFGNNYVDRGEIKRYRESYAFPGAELNELFGRSFGRAMLEWNLPPWRFRGAGSPGGYLTWARTALFGSVLVTEPDEDLLRETTRNVGAQIDFRFTVLSRLDMTLSLGYAVVLDDSDPTRDEFMASLKVF